MVSEIPYGHWHSPITPEMVSLASKSYNYLDISNGNVYWIEGNPEDKGRCALMRGNPEEKAQEVCPKEFNIRSKVHEYGGRPYLVDNDAIYFVNFKDQVFFVFSNHSAESLTNGNIRIAEPVATPQGIVCVAEKHSANGVENFLALIDPASKQIQTLASGQDFYGSPSLSQDGKKLAWISWNHPNMPWDGTELWTADLKEGKLHNSALIAGGENESIFQPQWSPEGILHYVSDKSGWWNLYRYQDGKSVNLYPIEAEFGLPLWVLGMSTYGFFGSEVVAAFQKDGIWKIARIKGENKAEILPYQYTDLRYFKAKDGIAAFIASFPDDNPKVIHLNLANGKTTVIGGVPLDPSIDRAYFSMGEPIKFPSSSGRIAYAFYYPPKNKDYKAPQGEKPPLLIRVHGGPTAHCTKSFSGNIQYWTTRGFAVADVNYGGSTGYGRAYRDSLKDNWGIVDKEDCEAAARYLIQKGLADPKKVVIDGGSAGGYTTLCVLTFGEVFTAGASYYGVSDLSLLALETHKFEAHYLDRLIGPYPEDKAVYDERSPLQQAELLKKPVIFFQGEEDKVVLPNQAMELYNALKEKGIRTELVLYPGEQHGFRSAETIQDTLKKELSFYLSIFES